MSPSPLSFVPLSFVLPHTPLPHTPLAHPLRRGRPRAPLCRRHAYLITSTASTLPLSPSDVHTLRSLSTQTVVITGATGLIGRRLVSGLRCSRASVHVFARDPPAARSLFVDRSLPPVSVTRYDAAEGTLSASAARALRAADVVINLAGEPVEDGRWTPARKRALWDSRVCGTRAIAAALADPAARAVLINASAVGYYGTSETDTFDERNKQGGDFLARLAHAWEQAALENGPASRTVVLRMGVVLARGGGALDKMSMAFRYFLGGPPGSGAQWFSWVHIDDVVRLILHASVDDRWRGVYNATAPAPVTLGEFCTELGKALGRPSWLPVPKQAVRALLGNEAAELILKGQRVVSTRMQENGFVYRFKDVASALRDLTKKEAE